MDPLTLINADCLTALRALPAESVQCCVTSPPYFGLRDYGHAGQIGLEQTPAAYVAKLIEVFGEVMRVLRADGTVWLNLGDSYAGSGRGGNPTEATSTLQGGQATQKAAMIGRKIKRGSLLPAGFHKNAVNAGALGRAWVPPPAGLKNKDLIGIPWRVAFALQEAGWYLRSEIIWHKPNPMPESIGDRPTKSHEHLFLLAKSPRYYYDAAAIVEPAIYADSGRESVERGGFDGKTNEMEGREAFRAITGTRNKRDVWTVASQPYKGAHFACFPPDLIKPCILAGAGPGAVVLDPFGGSGTTGAVALELGRRALLIELNPDYCELIRQRCAITPGLALA